MQGFAHMWTSAEAHPHATLQTGGTILTSEGSQIQVQFSHTIDGDNGVTTFIRTNITLSLTQWHAAREAVEALIANAIETGSSEIVSLSDLAEGVGA